MDLIKLSPVKKESIGRTYELALNPEKWPPFILKNHGLDKNCIEKLQKHLADCLICQNLHKNYKELSGNEQTELESWDKKYSKFIKDDNSFMQEPNDEALFKKIDDEFDREEWELLSEKDREHFKNTVLKALLDISDKLKSVEIAQAELSEMKKCRKAISIEKKYNKIESEIIELIKSILFDEYKNSCFCNLVYLNGSGYLNKFSMRFNRIVQDAEKEFAANAEKRENSIVAKITNKIENIFSLEKPLIKIILKHIESF